MRRVRIFAGLGDVIDPKAQRLYIYVECADVFPASAKVLQAAVRGRETFRFRCDSWSGHGRLDRLFPHLYSLSTDQGVLVRRAWNDAWVTPLPKALPDQQVAELISLQELLSDCCLSKAVQDV